MEQATRAEEEETQPRRRISSRRRSQERGSAGPKAAGKSLRNGESALQGRNAEQGREEGRKAKMPGYSTRKTTRGDADNNNGKRRMTGATHKSDCAVRLRRKGRGSVVDPRRVLTSTSRGR